MALLFAHPDVENYFVDFDYSTRDPHIGEQVTNLYEDGKCILLKNAKVDFDSKFMEEVDFTGKKELKKFKSIRFVREYFQSGIINQDLLNLVFDGDKGRLKYFAEQVRSVNDQMKFILRRLFPKYHVLNESLTWRLSETRNENLHFDVYREDLPDHHARLFLNLDTVPRIWHTSHSIEFLLGNHLNRLPAEFVKTATAGRLLHDLNFKVFGGWDEAGREGCPKHIGFFEPGDIWLADSRKISHQIFYGRRAVSTEYSIDKASMNDPSKHYFAIVDKYRSH